MKHSRRLGNIFSCTWPPEKIRTFSNFAKKISSRPIEKFLNALQKIQFVIMGIMALSAENHHRILLFGIPKDLYLVQMKISRLCTNCI